MKKILLMATMAVAMIACCNKSAEGQEGACCEKQEQCCKQDSTKECCKKDSACCQAEQVVAEVAEEVAEVTE